jgi:hypothetical protein
MALVSFALFVLSWPCHPLPVGRRRPARRISVLISSSRPSGNEALAARVAVDRLPVIIGDDVMMKR